MEEWHKRTCRFTGPMSRARGLAEFHDFYKRWNYEIFAFCLLVGGDRRTAESLTEQTFALYFRCADLVALRNCSHVPVSLLRFASDLAEIHCCQPLRAVPCEPTRALLALPFKERAAFVLVSMLKVPHSTAAVALGLRRGQLTDTGCEQRYHCTVSR